jgi:hypothetical protein
MRSVERPFWPGWPCHNTLARTSSPCIHPTVGGPSFDTLQSYNVSLLELQTIGLGLIYAV